MTPAHPEPDLLRSLSPSPPPASIQAAADLHQRGGLASLEAAARAEYSAPERIASLSILMCAELVKQHRTIRTYGRLIVTILALKFGLDLEILQSLLGGN
jgi:hypothetical protein